MVMEAAKVMSARRMMLRLVSVVLGASVVRACASQTGGVAASTIPLAPGGYTVLRDVTNRDCLILLFGLIPLTGGNSTREAVSRAISGAPGADALINVSADTYLEWWFVLTKTCTQVHGTAVALVSESKTTCAE